MMSVWGMEEGGGGMKRILGGQDKLQRSGAFLLLLNVQALKEVVRNLHGYFTGMLTQILYYKRRRLYLKWGKQSID